MGDCVENAHGGSWSKNVSGTLIQSHATCASPRPSQMMFVRLPGLMSRSVRNFGSSKNSWSSSKVLVLDLPVINDGGPATDVRTHSGATSKWAFNSSEDWLPPLELFLVKPPVLSYWGCLSLSRPLEDRFNSGLKLSCLQPGVCVGCLELSASGDVTLKLSIWSIEALDSHEARLELTHEARGFWSLLLPRFLAAISIFWRKSSVLAGIVEQGATLLMLGLGPVNVWWVFSSCSNRSKSMDFRQDALEVRRSFPRRLETTLWLSPSHISTFSAPFGSSRGCDWASSVTSLHHETMSVGGMNKDRRRGGCAMFSVALRIVESSPLSLSLSSTVACLGHKDAV
mmetsp:Transcript_6496/g.19270  ORF Transcript_6496/g.19270 Transcript_6496/m.19270 type:complete len:341 (+) Transcript_6496:1855-2877(+)